MTLAQAQGGRREPLPLDYPDLVESTAYELADLQAISRMPEFDDDLAYDMVQRLLSHMRQDPDMIESLTPLHWLGLERALYYYLVAKNTNDRAADRLFASLSNDVYRAVRKRDQLVETIQNEVAQMLVDVVHPDQHDVVLHRLRNTIR